MRNTVEMYYYRIYDALDNVWFQCHEGGGLHLMGLKKETILYSVSLSFLSSN